MKGNNERPQAELQRGTNKTQESVQMSSLKYRGLLTQVPNKIQTPTDRLKRLEVMYC